MHALFAAVTTLLLWGLHACDIECHVGVVSLGVPAHGSVDVVPGLGHGGWLLTVTYKPREVDGCVLCVLTAVDPEKVVARNLCLLAKVCQCIAHLCGDRVRGDKHLGGVYEGGASDDIRVLFLVHPDVLKHEGDGLAGVEIQWKEAGEGCGLVHAGGAEKFNKLFWCRNGGVRWGACLKRASHKVDRT